MLNYLIVVGYAVHFHGYVRSTGDLDLWIEKSEENLEKIKQSLITLGYPETGCENAINQVRNNKNFQIFDDRDRKIDMIQLYSTKLSFDEAFSRKEMYKKGNTTLFVISYDDLVSTKIRSGRGKDLLDVSELQKIKDLEKKIIQDKGRDKNEKDER